MRAETKAAYADLLAQVRESSKPVTARHLTAAEWAQKWNLSPGQAAKYIRRLRSLGVVDDAKRAGRPVYKLPDEFYEVGNGTSAVAVARR
jgi:hypothetical protein